MDICNNNGYIFILHCKAIYKTKENLNNLTKIIKKDQDIIDDNLKPGFESGITKKITFNELKEIGMKEKQK